MDFCISKVEVARKRVERLRTRGMQNSCDKIVSGLASECMFFVAFVDEASNEKSDDDECETKCA